MKNDCSLSGRSTRKPLKPADYHATPGDVGRSGEEAAAAYLSEIGYEILRRNFRLYGAEVDIIARYDAEIHFVEVKSWRSLGHDALEYAIDREKQRRIIRCAAGYLLSEYGAAEPPVRFDILLVDANNGSIRIISDAFGME